MNSRRDCRIVVIAILLGLQVQLAYANELETAPPAGDTVAVEIEPLDEPDPLFDDDFEDGVSSSNEDPFEGGNRKVFAFNQAIDTMFFTPIMKGYRFVVPGIARKGIQQAFQNFNSPSILVNDLLQLRFRDAGITFGRLVLNSFMGFGGLLDPATDAGLPYHDADFGQTLGAWGSPSGPYLMLPVLGPSTVRDGFGDLIDLAFQPLTYVLWPAQIMLQVYIGGGSGLAALDASYDKVNALEESSIDFYAALRSAYLQNRRAIIAEAIGEEVELEDLTLPDDDDGQGAKTAPEAILAY